MISPLSSTPFLRGTQTEEVGGEGEVLEEEGERVERRAAALREEITRLQAIEEKEAQESHSTNTQYQCVYSYTPKPWTPQPPSPSNQPSQPLPKASIPQTPLTTQAILTRPNTTPPKRQSPRPPSKNCSKINETFPGWGHACHAPIYHSKKVSLGACSSEGVRVAVCVWGKCAVYSLHIYCSMRTYVHTHSITYSITGFFTHTGVLTRSNGSWLPSSDHSRPWRGSWTSCGMSTVLHMAPMPQCYITLLIICRVVNSTISTIYLQEKDVKKQKKDIITCGGWS